MITWCYIKIIKEIGQPIWKLHEPYCMKNLAEDAKQASTISRLDKELKRWMKDCGDEGQPTEMRAFEHMPGKRK